MMLEQELRDGLRATVATADPPPPMSVATQIRAGRRAVRQRFALLTGGGSAAVVVAVVVALAIATNSGPGQAMFPGGVAPAPGTTNESGEPWPTGPDGRPQEDRTAKAGERHEQGVRLLNELRAVVPAGHTVRDGRHQAEFSDRIDGVDIWNYLASVGVAKDPGTGRLYADVTTPGNAFRGEECALTRQFWGMQGECHVVAVGTVRVGVVVRPTGGDQRLDQWAAYRHPDGVVVFIAQTKMSEDGAALAKLPLSVQELATLAVDPRFHLT